MSRRLECIVLIVRWLNSIYLLFWKEQTRLWEDMFYDVFFGYQAGSSQWGVHVLLLSSGTICSFHAKAAEGIALSSRKYLLSHLQNKENLGFCKIIILLEFNSCGIYYTHSCISLCSPPFGVVCHDCMSYGLRIAAMQQVSGTGKGVLETEGSARSHHLFVRTG